MSGSAVRPPTVTTSSEELVAPNMASVRLETDVVVNRASKTKVFEAGVVEVPTVQPGV